MTQETKRFPLRVLLTVTTGRLLTASKGPDDNGISDLYELLGWMTRESPFTHQLPRFGDECKPWLLRWFPELERCWSETAQACLVGLRETLGDSGVEQWLKQCEEVYRCKPEFDVPRIPHDDHTRRDPIDELAEKIGRDKIIVVEVPPTE